MVIVTERNLYLCSIHHVRVEPVELEKTMDQAVITVLIDFNSWLDIFGFREDYRELNKLGLWIFKFVYGSWER